MPRVQVYLPDDLYEGLKSRGLPASKLFQQAVRTELARQVALEATDQYLAELVAEVGEPTAADRAWAEKLFAGLGGDALDRAG